MSIFDVHDPQFHRLVLPNAPLLKLGEGFAWLEGPVWFADQNCLRVVADDFAGPNGLCFSPDERRLYVSESGAQFAVDPVQHIQVFDVLDDGARLSDGRVFHTVAPGFADGFRCDEAGRIWSSAADGVHCIAPDGTLLGRIKVPFTVSNLTFGGRNRARLFICASHTL